MALNRRSLVHAGSTFVLSHQVAPV